MKSFLEIKRKIAALPFFSSPLFNKYRVFIVPFITLIVALVIVVLVTIPQFLALFQTFKTIDELTLKKQTYQEKVSKLEKIDVASNRQDLDTALIALPVEKDLPGVMGELLVALNSSGLALDGINFSNSPVESNKAEEYTMDLDVSGSEESLRSFLERIKLLPRLIKLTSIDITNGRTELSANMTFAAFYQLLPTSIGSIDADVPSITPAETQVLTDIEAKVQAFPKVSQPTSQTVTGKLDPFTP